MTYKTYHDATTRLSVINAVKDLGDEAAWGRFFDLYAGFVFAVARKKGLNGEDADEVVQAVFTDLARAMPRFEYDRAKGKFRSYLLSLINWRVIDRLKANKRDHELKDDCRKKVRAGDLPAAKEPIYDQEWEGAALDEALRRLSVAVNPEHFAAFVECSIEGIDVETVTRLHGLTRDNLYQIRSRMTAKLKPLVAAVLKEMNEGPPPLRGAADPR